MKNEQTNAPTTLTSEQTEMVSGGALPTVGLRAGCPTCTSGLPIAFLNIAAIVNPAPMVQALG
jgi:hypothetical protein